MILAAPPTTTVDELDDYAYDNTVDDGGTSNDGAPFPCSPPPMVYRRGVGFADVAQGKWAHGGTIYQTASVAKVFGGTLAKMLEEEYPDFDLTEQVRDRINLLSLPPTFSTTLPAGHTYTYHDIFAHDACVKHYDFFPGDHGTPTRRRCPS